MLVGFCDRPYDLGMLGRLLGFGAPPLFGNCRQADLLKDTGLVQNPGPDPGERGSATVADVHSGIVTVDSVEKKLCVAWRKIN